MKSRYLWYYLAARIFLWLFLEFVIPEMGFFGFVGKYWWWLILVSVSYFTYWYFQGYEEKVYQYLRTFLLIGNGYLFLHLFFRPLLTIEPALFLLLGVIVGLMWYVSKLHMKYKRPFYVVGSCISFLILISGLFYLYPEKPDIEGFIRQQQIQLLLHSPMTQPQRIAYLKLTNLWNQKVQELLFQTGTQYFSIPEQYQLSYISTHLQNVAEVFVLFPDGKLFQLFPQSSVTFEEEMVLEAGLSGRYATLWTGNTGDEKYLSTTHFYWKNLQAYLTQQIGSTFTASPTVQALNRKLLSYLVHIFPGFFEQNVKNAKQFTYYFSLFDDTSSFLMAEKYFISPDVSAERSLWSQIKQNIELAFPLLKSF